MQPPNLSDKRVLSVDDSRAIRAFVTTLLSNTGAPVDETGSGEEAITLATSASPHYDLILLDLVLPDIDGLEVLRRIREHDQESTIVVLTGAGGIASATAAMQYGADGYVEKQYVTQVGGEPEFFYSLQQALEHRAGYVARQQLDQLRTDFYSMITHDLRNPASTVQGFITLLLSGKGGPLQPRQEEMLKAAQRSADKLVSLITNYLDYAKIEAGYLRIDPAPTDLAALIRACMEQSALLARTKNHEIVFEFAEEPFVILADADKMSQVFDNLISNAIKYTPDGGRITLYLQREDDTAVFRITDTGCGIPPQQLQSIFAKYHRAPGAERWARGSGLGLLIVKEIVEAHQGTISVESAGVAGQGASFTVRLPIR